MKHIIAVLQLPRLKEEAESAISLLDKKFGKALFVFIEFLKKEAVTVERIIPLRDYSWSMKNTRGIFKSSGKNGDSQKQFDEKENNLATQNGKSGGSGIAKGTGGTVGYGD